MRTHVQRARFKNLELVSGHMRTFVHVFRQAAYEGRLVVGGGGEREGTIR